MDAGRQAEEGFQLTPQPPPSFGSHGFEMMLECGKNGSRALNPSI
jgi:hypothetical protein